MEFTRIKLRLRDPRTVIRDDCRFIPEKSIAVSNVTFVLNRLV